MAIYDLKIPEQLFWRLTPKEYGALTERLRENQRYDNIRMERGPAQICAVLANVNRGKNSKVYSFQDFMFTREKTEPKKPMTGMEMKEVMQQACESYNRSKTNGNRSRRIKGKSNSR